MIPHRSNPETLAQRYPELWPLVEAERVALYEGLDWDADAATTYELYTDEAEFLLGNCHMNASEMAKRLDDNGYDPIIVLGYLGGEFGDPVPTAPAEAVSESNCHIWVELEADTETGYLVIEPCTEWPEAPGLPYISPRRPQDYYPNASRFEWEPWMTHEIVGVESRVDEFLDRATRIPEPSAQYTGEEYTDTEPIPPK